MTIYNIISKSWTVISRKFAKCIVSLANCIASAKVHRFQDDIAMQFERDYCIFPTTGQEKDSEWSLD